MNSILMYALPHLGMLAFIIAAILLPVYLALGKDFFSSGSLKNAEIKRKVQRLMGIGAICLGAVFVFNPLALSHRIAGYSENFLVVKAALAVLFYGGISFALVYFAFSSFKKAAILRRQDAAE